MTVLKSKSLKKSLKVFKKNTQFVAHRAKRMLTTQKYDLINLK